MPDEPDRAGDGHRPGSSPTATIAAFAAPNTAQNATVENPGAIATTGTGTAVAGLCLLAVAAIVGYGLWIIIS